MLRSLIQQTIVQSMHCCVSVCVSVCLCVTVAQPLIWPLRAGSPECASSSWQCSWTPYTTPPRAAARLPHTSAAPSPAAPEGGGGGVGWRLQRVESGLLWCYHLCAMLQFKLVEVPPRIAKVRVNLDSSAAGTNILHCNSRQYSSNKYSVQPTAGVSVLTS